MMTPEECRLNVEEVLRVVPSEDVNAPPRTQWTVALKTLGKNPDTSVIVVEAEFSEFYRFDYALTPLEIESANNLSGMVQTVMKGLVRNYRACV